MGTTIYATVRVDSKGKPLGGMFERKYRATDEATAAELAASNGMTRDQYGNASVTYNEDGVWTFTPGTGAPVRIRVTEVTAQDAAEQAEADEHEQQQLDVMGKHEETLAERPEDPKAEAIAVLFGGRQPAPQRPEGATEHVPTDPNAADRTRPFGTCSGCGKRIGWAVTDRDDVLAWRTPAEITDANGHGTWCMPTAAAPAPEGPRSECCGEPMSPENRCENCGQRGTPELQTWSDVDVVARTEQLHPITHPYRANEVVEYVGPSGIGSWVHGPMYFRRMVENDMAEIMTTSGPKYVEVANLRRPSGNIAIELTPEDIRRIFQALATESDRLGAIEPQLWPDALALTVELRDRFAALHR